ncbi:hypothetical protein [Flavobacterium cellulosilyticum]|uniref:Lipoprotein n=1 Tax=Flavobacterium cellulosilyticum TaxID=2541731 RepID=A0A4R5C3N2_9FLAO|nr:hypothetical protein [Flavobacterium cellulosilyticum]TDD94291.1 hypothetical protein E0F76_16975 [Flavobacterium cellulosilyticum]
MKQLKWLLIIVSCAILTSCYSVRLRNVNGTPQPDPFSNRKDYYRGMAVVELDTIISIKITSKDFTYLIKEKEACESGKLNIIEYRNTFGGVLLSAITFGKKRKVTIKYVCEKPSN